MEKIQDYLDINEAKQFVEDQLFEILMKEVKGRESYLQKTLERLLTMCYDDDKYMNATIKAIDWAYKNYVE